VAQSHRRRGGPGHAERRSAFDEPGRPKSHILFRTRDLPPRVLDLFLATPGVAVFRPVSQNVAVEVGFAHLIDLASCQSLFEQARFYLFWGKGTGWTSCRARSSCPASST
jgi:hypothetical protein